MLFPVSESPLYVEVIDSDPAGRVLVVTVATPGVLSVPDPTDVGPVLEHDSPRWRRRCGRRHGCGQRYCLPIDRRIQGFRLEVGTFVVEGYRFTICVIVPELDLNFASPT